MFGRGLSSSAGLGRQNYGIVKGDEAWRFGGGNSDPFDWLSQEFDVSKPSPSTGVKLPPTTNTAGTPGNAVKAGNANTQIVSSFNGINFDHHTIQTAKDNESQRNKVTMFAVGGIILLAYLNSKRR